MKKITGLTCLALTGCVLAPPMTIPQAESLCATEPFAVYGNCIQNQLDTAYPAWRSNHEADLAQVYLSWLQAAGSRVESGEMSEPDAKLGAATIRLRLKEIQAQRSTQAAFNQQQAMQNMLMGLALVNASQPQPQQNTSIVCNSYRYGNNTTTTCR